MTGKDRRNKDGSRPWTKDESGAKFSSDFGAGFKKSKDKPAPKEEVKKEANNGN